jgi:hypothetical protein
MIVVFRPAREAAAMNDDRQSSFGDDGSWPLIKPTTGALCRAAAS